MKTKVVSPEMPRFASSECQDLAVRGGDSTTVPLLMEFVHLERQLDSRSPESHEGIKPIFGLCLSVFHFSYSLLNDLFLGTIDFFA
jgi:glutamine amidotransferase PdxT